MNLIKQVGLVCVLVVHGGDAITMFPFKISQDGQHDSSSDADVESAVDGWPTIRQEVDLSPTVLAQRGQRNRAPGMHDHALVPARFGLVASIRMLLYVAVGVAVIVFLSFSINYGRVSITTQVDTSKQLELQITRLRKVLKRN